MKSVRSLSALALIAFGLTGCTESDCNSFLPADKGVLVDNQSTCTRLVAYEDGSGSTHEIQPKSKKKLFDAVNKRIFIPKGNCGGSAKDERIFGLIDGDKIIIFGNGVVFLSRL